MIGLVVVTHGGLARELLKAAEHVVGPQAQTEFVCVEPDDDPTARTQDIKDAAARVDTGAGTIVLTDIYGSTPCNAAIAAVSEGGGQVIAGVNVPMLVKLFSTRTNDNMQSAVAAAKTAGQKYICVSDEVAAKKAAT